MGAVDTVMFVQVRAGSSVSLTVMVNEQALVPSLFVTVQVTMVLPAGKARGDVTTTAPVRQVTPGVGQPEAAVVNATV